MDKKESAIVEEFLTASDVLEEQGVTISMDSNAYYLHLPCGEHWTTNHDGLIGIALAFGYLRGKNES